MGRIGGDVVVVGGELSGLVAGALLAVQGKRVIVLDDGAPPDASPLHDRILPTAPALWRAPAQGPAAGVLESLGLKADARRELGEPVGLGAVDDPDVRVVVPLSQDARVRELSRVFGDDKGAAFAAALAGVALDRRHGVLAELAALHEDGWFFQARRARKRVLAFGRIADVDAADDDVTAFGVPGRDDGLAPLLHQLQPFVQSRVDQAPHGLGGALAAAQLAVGAPVPARGGLGPRVGLRNLLHEVLRKRGAEFVRARVESVVVDGRRITSLQTTSKDEVVARAVIDATHLRDLASRTADSRARRNWLEAQARVEDVGEAVVVRRVLPVARLPRGLPPTLLLLREAPSQPILLSILVGAPRADVGKGAQIDDSLVALVAAMPCDSGATDAACDDVDAALDALLPFSRDAVVASDRIHGAAAQAALGRYRVVKSEHVLVGRRPRTAMKNVVRAGRDLCPGWGVDGEIVAARAVVALVDKLFPKPPTP